MSRSRPTLILLLACVAQFMLLVDDTITNVALPTIGRELHFSVANLSWVVNAYLLTFGGLLLVGGRLADRFGPRRVFAVSLAGFAAASALCGIAPSSGVLVGARALQGTFGALLSPSALALLLAASPAPAERRRALAIWAGLLGLGAATGLLDVPMGDRAQPRHRHQAQGLLEQAGSALRRGHRGHEYRTGG